MKTSRLAKLRAALFPAVERDDRSAKRRAYERFAIPYTFKPQMSFPEAVIAALGAFLRILLGSLLFAFWGAYSLSLGSAIRNVFWRVAVLLPMFLLFLGLFALLMLAIGSLVRTLLGKRDQKTSL